MSTPKNNHQTAIGWTELKDTIETIYELNHEMLRPDLAASNGRRAKRD